MLQEVSRSRSDSSVVLAYNWTSAVRPENASIATVAIWLLYRYLQIVLQKVSRSCAILRVLGYLQGLQRSQAGECRRGNGGDLVVIQ